jgi:hypothetical protein
VLKKAQFSLDTTQNSSSKTKRAPQKAYNSPQLGWCPNLDFSSLGSGIQRAPYPFGSFLVAGFRCLVECPQFIGRGSNA